MAVIPTYTAPDPTAPSAEKSYIGNTSLGADKLADAALSYAAKVAKDQAEEQGLQDQATAGVKPVAEDTGFFGLPTIYSEAYNKAARGAFLAVKKSQLENDVAGLEQQYRYDPATLQSKLTEYRQGYFADIPLRQQPTFDLYFQNHTQTVLRRSQATDFQQKFEQNKAAILDRFTQVSNRLASGFLGDPAAQGEQMTTDAIDLAHILDVNTKPTKDGPPLIDPVSAVAMKEKLFETLSTAQAEAHFKALPSFAQKQDFINEVSTGAHKVPRLPGLIDSDVAMPAKLALTLGNHLTTLFKQDQAEAQGQIALRWKDDIAMREAGKGILVSDAQIRAAYDPISAAQMIGQQKAAGEFYKATQYIKLSTFDQDQALVGSKEPRPGIGFAVEQAEQAAIKLAVDRKWKAVTEDPALYVEQQSTALAALRASNDPADKQTYISQQQSTQTQMGLPGFMQTAIPKGVAISTANEISTLDPVQASSRVDQLAQQYGQHWPAVWAQIVRDGKIPTNYQALAVLNEPQDATARKSFASALVAGEKTLKQNLEKADVQTIEQGVIGATSDFARTARYAGANDGFVNMMNDNVRTLAYFYAGHGESASSALDHASRDFLSRYQFTDTYRVPAVTIGTVAYSPREMARIAEANTATVKEAIKPDDLALPPKRPNEMLTDEQRGKELATNAKRGFWINNDDIANPGLLLVYPNREFVKRRDGSPITVPFATMNPDRRTEQGDIGIPAGSY